MEMIYDLRVPSGVSTTGLEMDGVLHYSNSKRLSILSGIVWFRSQLGYSGSISGNNYIQKVLESRMFQHLSIIILFRATMSHVEPIQTTIN
jgi:hypothetical protein